MKTSFLAATTAAVVGALICVVPMAAASRADGGSTDAAVQTPCAEASATLTLEAALEAWSKRFGRPYPTHDNDPGWHEHLSDDDLRLVVAIEGHRKIEPLVTFCLSLGNRPITDAGLSHLRNFSLLQEIDLSNTQVTDKGLEFLATCINLNVVNLSNTKITDRGLERLGKLHRVTRLNIDGTKVTDAGLKHLAAMKNLRILRTSVTGTGVAMLPQRKELQAFLSATELPPDLPLDKFKELGLGVVKYPLADFATKVFPGERLDIDADAPIHNLQVALRGHGAFAWSLPLPPQLLRDWLKKYQIASLRLVALPSLDDDAILGLPANHSLEKVVVEVRDGAASHPAVTDKGIAHLCRSKHLHSLSLPNVDLTATGLAAVASSPTLASVRLSGGRIQGAPTQPCEGNVLSELVLENITLPPGVLTWLAQNCTSIKRLRIANTPITAQELVGFKGLVHADLVNVGISDDDLVNFRGATRLESLDLSENTITGRGFAALTALKSLRAIDLRDTRVEAGSLDHLVGLPKLARLDCRPSISDDKAQELSNRHKWIFQRTGTDGDEDVTPEQQ